MRIKNLYNTIHLARTINRPLLIWGAPGVGKSSLVHQYAADQGCDVLDWRLTEMESVDMRGTPREKNGRTYWAPPIELPEPGTKGIMFLDELAQARMEVKNVAARLVLERRIGEWRLPEGWWIVAASNRLDDKAGTSPMPTHLNGRFWHAEVEVSVEDWMVWAERMDIDFRVVAYLKYRPGALLAFDPKSKEAAFASPRSWHLLSDMIKAMGSEDQASAIDAALMGEWASGAVGRAHGMEFVGFLRTMLSLVSIEQILLDPDKVPVSTDPSVSYALATGLALQVKRDSIASAFRYMERVGKEFAFVFAKKVENVMPALRKTKAFVDFCALNADYI